MKTPCVTFLPYLLKKKKKKSTEFFFQKSPGTEEVTAQYTLAREETSQDRLRQDSGALYFYAARNIY